MRTKVENKKIVTKVLNMMKTGTASKPVETSYVEAKSSRVLSGTIYGHKAIELNPQL